MEVTGRESSGRDENDCGGFLRRRVDDSWTGDVAFPESSYDFVAVFNIR